eukprot:scaffold11714_cov123-Skeletonema_marinoi.AAC.2
MSAAEETTKLPSGWKRGISQTLNRPYYYHPDSKHTQWHYPTPAEAADPIATKAKMMEERQQKKRPKTSSSQTSQSSSTLPSVAIIVPYRDLHTSQNRAKHLSKFIPYMKQYLTNLITTHKIQDYHIYIIEQSNDQRKFNRGKLLNIGFDYALKRSVKHPPKHTIFIFHDVDLLPQPDVSEWYATIPTKPIHIARVWDRYSNNTKYFGGIVSFSESDMKRINGYPNTFWGWGGEDDEMQKRLETCGIQWVGPSSGTIQDLEMMDLKTKLGFLKENKEWKCMVKWEALEEHAKTWRVNGLADLSYDILKIERMDKEDEDEGGSKVTKLTTDVKLNGDHWANDRCGVEYLPP